MDGIHSLSALHLSLVMTFDIVQLSWPSIYWKNLEDTIAEQNSFLTLIPFVAKTHDTCTVASLSDLVLYQIQSDLVGWGGGGPLLVCLLQPIRSHIFYIWSGVFGKDPRQSY